MTALVLVLVLALVSARVSAAAETRVPGAKRRAQAPRALQLAPRPLRLPREHAQAPATLP
jgi:hypothetical protein